MPSRNSIKDYAPDTMYHVYNRGVDKRIIFVDQRDYAVFLSYLKYALLPHDHKEAFVDTSEISDAQRFNMRRLGLANDIKLVAFCLMPNHFHLLVFQYEPDAMTRLLRSTATGYSMYFNKRYGRTGVLFQGRYKASRIDNDAYWQHIARYIHLNPIDLGVDFTTYSYSSYMAYMGEQQIAWLDSTFILGEFSNSKEYHNFTTDYIEKREELREIKGLLAES